MLGVIVPAHNEAAAIAACLRSLELAARHPDLAGEEVCVLVVLDGCTDGTAMVVAQHAATALAVTGRNVGAARAAGAALLLSQGARWLAFTDADTRVAPDWLARQLALGADAVCGTVTVDDWSDHGDNAAGLQRHFERTYFDVEDHRHIHGANLGVSAAAYLLAGGFSALACSEDVALVAALQAAGARIAWSSAPRVVTSARRQARAPKGFAAALCAAVDAMLAPGHEPGAACPLPGAVA